MARKQIRNSQRQLLDLMPATARAMAEATGRDYGNVCRSLRSLAALGLAERKLLADGRNTHEWHRTPPEEV